MKFKKTTIPPEGRNKYGNYMSAENITKAVINTTYYGNSTGGNNGSNKPDENEKGPEDSFLMMLSKTSGSYDGRTLALMNIEDSIELIGYKNLKRCDVYVGDILEETNGNTMHDIVGIPEDGLTVTVEDNGTPNAKLKITLTSAITQDVGSLRIPCNVYRKSVEGDSLGNDASAWESLKDECSTLWLEYSWTVLQPATEAYHLELSNEVASINCDKNGNILSGAIRPTCQATLWYGTEQMEDVTYSISCPSSQNVVGLSINTSTGELTFGTNFSFDGYPLEIGVSATYLGKVVGVKIMTVTKNFPGDDGADAVTRWLKLSASVVKIDRNYNPPRVVPETISATVMKQVGAGTPVEDTGAKIYYGYDTDTPGTEYSSAVSVNVSKSYMTFGLKNASGEIYELETIPYIEAGINGQDGQDGKDGKDGLSAYRLDLTNDNASINCDSNGNVLAGAYLPKCTARLFVGTSLVEGVTYKIDAKSEATDKITINASTGVITIDSGISFTATALEVTIGAYIGQVLYGQSIFTLTKSIAGVNGTNGKDGENGKDGVDGKNGEDGADGADGADGKDGVDGKNGQDAVSYWMEFSTSEVKLDKNGTPSPSSITVKGYKQVGAATPVDITSSITIKYGYDTVSPQTTYTSAITIPANTSSTYLTFAMYSGSTKIDGNETILILKDGKDGTNGKDGADGKDGKDGANGRQGAAMRGPVNYYSQTTSRRWCNGKLTSSSYPEDAEFIDIIVKDDVTYICNTSYNGSANDSWSSVSSKWTRVDNKYDFVATNILLAKNASIDFATSNGLYLRDNSGVVTAGAQGGAGTSFWAGANEPANGTFKVNYDGTMTATKGKFGLLEIGKDDWNRSVLKGNSTQTDGTLNTLSIQPDMIRMIATDGSKNYGVIQIGPYADPDHYDTDGEIDVSVNNPNRCGVSTNGTMFSNGYSSYVNYRHVYAPYAPVNNFTITFMTDTNYFTKSGGIWYWKGMPLPQHDASDYPYVKLIGGEWNVCTSSSSSSGIGTGIYGTSHTKTDNRLYIVI